MKAESIGIKVADGSFYPVLEQDFKGKKRLVLTTARDDQSTVQIDLYQGEGEKAEQTDYIGSLIIENIQEAPKGEAEIEVVLGVDEEGNLNATANDLITGEKQSLSVSLESITSVGPITVPEFGIEENFAEPDLEETLLTGETYPIGPTDRRREHLERRKRSPFLLVGFVLLGLLLIAGIAFLIFGSLGGASIPSLLGGRVSSPQIAEAPPAAAELPTAVPEEAEAEIEEIQAAEKAPAAEKKTPTGVSYLIKRGDTLWDISSTYYRNPWLYPKIARANGIIDPDIIFAGKTIFIPEN